MDGQSRICNWLYNRLLEKSLALRQIHIESGDKEAAKLLYRKRGLRNLVPAMKVEHPFLKSVHSSPLKNAALRIESSIQDRQKSKNGKRKGKVTGFPRFRSQKQKWFSLLYDEPNKGFKIEGRQIRLSLGADASGRRIYAHGQLEKSLASFKTSRILNLRITKENNEFFAIFGVEKDLPKTRPIKRFVALDPNHKNLAHGVDSEGRSFEIANPYFLKKLDKVIDEIKGKRDRCQRQSILKTTEYGRKYYEPSRRWSCFNKVLETLYMKRREQTKVFLYAVSNKLFKNYDHVAIGDYTPRGGGINKGMRRSMNNQSLIGRFKSTLSWVALRGGKSYDEWNEWGSSVTCSTCGHQRERLDPSIRSWQCLACDTQHYRDENAARNGLFRVAQKIMVPCSGHLDLESRCTWRFNGLEIVAKTVSGFVNGETVRSVGAGSKMKLNSAHWSAEPSFARILI